MEVVICEQKLSFYKIVSFLTCRIDMPAKGPIRVEELRRTSRRCDDIAGEFLARTTKNNRNQKNRGYILNFLKFLKFGVMSLSFQILKNWVYILNISNKEKSGLYP